MEDDQGKSESVAHADQGAAGLEQVREILFGAAQRDLERRLARADGALSARARELEQQVRRRTEVLEAHIKKETEALDVRLERDVEETSEAIRKIMHEHRDAVASLEQRLAKMEESSARAQRELRHQLLEQATTFLDELQSLRKELLATLQQELGLAEGELREGQRDDGDQARH